MSKKDKPLDCKYFENNDCCFDCGSKCIRAGKQNPSGRPYRVCCKTLILMIGKKQKSRPLHECYVNREY